MSDPKVVAVMLIADRKELGEKAVACFRAQTYQNKRLIIFDTGKEAFRQEFQTGLPESWWWEESHGRTIGELRNRAAEIPPALDADIIVHWDSDDWSHPQRIEEQVELLKDGSAGCVGYSDMLFWRTFQPTIQQLTVGVPRPSEAWLWRGAQNRPIGTSLCYWRWIWEAHPFKALPIGDSVGEDVDFVRRVDAIAVTIAVTSDVYMPIRPFPNDRDCGQRLPRMIARIHAGNTSTGYGQIESSSSWKRIAEFDAFCRRQVMA